MPEESLVPSENASKVSTQKSLRETFTRSMPIYILLTALVGLICFYFFYYIPLNEKRLDSYADRLISNSSRAAIEKFKSYQEAIASNPLGYTTRWALTVNKIESGFFGVRKDTLFFSSLGKQTDVRAKYVKLEKHTYEELNVGQLDSNLAPETHGPTKGDPYRVLWQVKNGNRYFVFDLPYTFYNLDRGKTEDAFLWLSTQGYTQNIKSYDFFDDLFIVAGYDKGAAPNIDSVGVVAEGTVIDKSQLGLTHFSVPDSIKDYGAGTFEKVIGGRGYRAYIKQMHLRRGLDVYLVGLVSLDDLNREARVVTNWFVVFCLLATLMLLFSLPVVKVFIIKKDERLSAWDARLSVFSVILTASLATIILVGSYITWQLEHDDMSRQMKTLAHRVRELTKDQISELQLALSDSRVFRSPLTTKKAHPNIQGYNEIFQLDTSGKVVSAFDEKKSLSLFFEKFKTDLRKREYFSEAISSYRNKVDQDCAIVPINSYSSGLTEVAISKFDQQAKLINVITSRLPSLVRSKVPEPFRFLVTDRKGNVKFHSEWTEIQNENFIQECSDNSAIDDHINNGSESELEFAYLQADCIGYGVPINGQWQLIVYYELSHLRNLAAEVFRFCLITLGAILLGLAFVQLALSQDRSKYILIRGKTFFYDWLSPRIATSETWKRLSFFNLTLFLGQCIWFFICSSIVATIPFVVANILAFYIASYAVLKSQDPFGLKRESKTQVWLVASFIIVLITLIGGLLLTESYTPAGFTIILFSLLGLILSWMNGRTQRRNEDVTEPTTNKGSTSSWAYSNWYRGYFATALLVLAVGPSVLFISQHYYFLSMARQANLAVEDVKSVQYRNPFPDVPKLRGFDYTEKAIISNKPIAVENDIDFYALFQNFYVSKSRTPYSFNSLPNANQFRIQFGESLVKVSAPAFPLSSSSRQITRTRPVSGLRLNAEGFILTIFLAVFSMGFIYWRLLASLPKRIFYYPPFPFHHGQPAIKGEKNFLEREFEGDNLHPLAALPELKTKLEDDALKELKEIGADEGDLTKKLSHLKTNSEPSFWAFCDKYIFLLQKDAESAYNSAWEKCSRKEKYFLYDLATDGITNFSNLEIVKKLAEKGLIRTEPVITIVNRSFANFVLDSLSSEEIIIWNQEERFESNWVNLRVMAALVIIATLVFISISVDGFLGRATALLASLSFVAPRIFDIFSSIGNLLKGKLTAKGT